MKNGFLVFVFFLSLCLSGCSSKIPPIEEQLSFTESMMETPVSNVLPESVKEDQNREMKKNSILQVQTDTRLGSGVLWEKQEEEWIAVTAAHVVEEQQEVDVCLVHENRILPAKVEVVEGLDLAFLRVSVVSLDEKVREKYSAAVQIMNTVEEGAIIYARGYNPYGEFCEVTGKVLEDWIYVEDFDNYMLICDCQASPGMSGGAAVTENGSLAGLICGENEKGVLAVLPVSVIQSEYEVFRKD